MAGKNCKNDAILLISLPHEIPPKAEMFSGFFAVWKTRGAGTEGKEKIASRHEIVVR